MQNKKKWIFNAIFFLLVIGATVYGVFHGENLGEIRSCLSQAKVGWWCLGVAAVVIFIVSESIIIYYMLRSLGQSPVLCHCFLYSFVGFFFSCITPMAGGGQPAQVYFMSKDDIPVAVAIPVLMMVTITYKMVLVVFGAAVLLLRPPVLMAFLAPVMGWCYLGLALNILFISGLLALIFCPILVERPLQWGLNKLTRWVPEEKVASWRRRLAEGILRYQSVAEYYRRHRGSVMLIFLMTCFQRIVLFLVPCFAYWSFSLQGIGAGTIVTLQAMISVAADMLPLPGGMGITESLFLQIFQPICGAKLVVPVLVISRGISYYTQLILSAAFTILAIFVIGKKRVTHDRVL